MGDFALEDQQGAKRSARDTVDLPDLFEHDPFKVQSYKFRYADRPEYPLQTPMLSQSPQSNFREKRRRKFLHATNQALHSNYNRCNSSSASSGYLGASTPAFENNYECTNSCPYNNYNKNVTTRQPVLQQKPSALSLCEIQININGSDHAYCPKNVVINIATDRHGAITTTNNQNNSTATTEQYLYCGRATARRQSRHSIDRSPCYARSSDSSCDSDTPLKQSLQWRPQFLSLKTLDNKVPVSKEQPVTSRSREQIKNFVPFVIPPWVLGAKTYKEPPISTNALRKCLSNQTIINNLNNSQDFKCKPFKRSVTSISNNFAG